MDIHPGIDGDIEEAAKIILCDEVSDDEGIEVLRSLVRRQRVIPSLFLWSTA